MAKRSRSPAAECRAPDDDAPPLAVAEAAPPQRPTQASHDNAPVVHVVSSPPPPSAGGAVVPLQQKAEKFFRTRVLFEPLYRESFCFADPLAARLLAALKPHIHKPYLEVELRFCILTDDHKQRLRLPIDSPAVVTKVKSAEAQLSRGDFDTAIRLLHDAWAYHVPRAGGVAVVQQSHTRDRNHGGLRDSFDAATGQHLCRIKKQRLALCDISCPRHRLDLRFAVNQEVPVFDTAPVVAPTSSTGSSSDACTSSESTGSASLTTPSFLTANMGGGGYVREKKRTSFIAGPFQFDATEVRSGQHGPVVYELELEGRVPFAGTPQATSAAPSDEGGAVSAVWMAAMLGNAFAVLDAVSGVVPVNNLKH